MLHEGQRPAKFTSAICLRSAIRRFFHLAVRGRPDAYGLAEEAIHRFRVERATAAVERFPKDERGYERDDEAVDSVMIISSRKSLLLLRSLVRTTAACRVVAKTLQEFFVRTFSL